VKHSLSTVAVWLSAFALACGATIRFVPPAPYLELDQMSVEKLRAALVRNEDAVKAGALKEGAAEKLRQLIASRIRELEVELPVLHYWAEVGKIDAKRDAALGRLHYYTIDLAMFYADGDLSVLRSPTQPDWNLALLKLTGATALPVRTHGSDLRPLAARVDGYNEEVWRFLMAKHGPNIQNQVGETAQQSARQTALRQQT
jgi:hypothetical protein